MSLTATVKGKSLVITFLMLVLVSVILMKNALFKRRTHFKHLPTTTRNVDHLCEPEQPCRYSDKVDLRILVLTFHRPVSLIKLLEDLNALELDSQSAALEIWIDRSRRTNKVDEQTVKVASVFQWSKGPSRVHVQARHVGLYGQWINTWRPPDDSNNELALILEDDLSVSKYAYRWVRAVFRAYGNRTDFAGASAVGYQWPYLSTSRQKGKMTGPKSHTVVMHKCFGWWGFAPKPTHWRLFQVGYTFYSLSLELYYCKVPEYTLLDYTGCLHFRLICGLAVVFVNSAKSSC